MSGRFVSNMCLLYATVLPSSLGSLTWAFLILQDLLWCCEGPVGYSDLGSTPTLRARHTVRVDGSGWFSSSGSTACNCPLSWSLVLNPVCMDSAVSEARHDSV
ncbi:hypothetical protein ECG_05465 [Echinococcus granulosus]|nr:hypothetical protein ECG_05465 [Echinococcus granulosus]